jgi:hypothetical protein
LKIKIFPRNADMNKTTNQTAQRKERKGKERKGKERKGKERKGKERKGKERKGKEKGRGQGNENTKVKDFP